MRRTRYRAARVRAAEPCQMRRCGRTRSGAGQLRGSTGRIRIAAGELRDGCARPASGFARRRRPCALVRRRVLPGGAAAVHLRQRFPCRGVLRAGGVVAVRGTPDRRRGGCGEADPRPLCRPGRQDDALCLARGARRAGRRQRDRPPPCAGTGGQRPQVGYGQCRCDDLRTPATGRLRGVVRRGGRRCSLLGRRDVPQGCTGLRRMERGECKALCCKAGRDIT